MLMDPIVGSRFRLWGGAGDGAGLVEHVAGGSRWAELHRKCDCGGGRPMHAGGPVESTVVPAPVPVRRGERSAKRIGEAQKHGHARNARGMSQAEVNEVVVSEIRKGLLV